MNCKEVNENLLFYLDNELIEREKQSIDLHLASCPHCRKELEALSETKRILKQGLESIASKSAPVWAWAELESRLKMLDDTKPARARRVASKIKGFVSWEPKWKPVLTSILAIVLIVSSALFGLNTVGPTPEALASEIANDSPEVKALSGGEPIVEATRVSGTVAYVLSNGTSGESNLAYVDLKEGVVTKLFRLTVPPLTVEDKVNAVNIAMADPNVQQILGNDGNITDVFLFTPRLRLEIIDGKPAVWSQGILANAVLRVDDNKWIARIDVGEGKVVNISYLTAPSPTPQDGKTRTPYSKEELFDMVKSDTRVAFLLDQGAEVTHVATGSRKMANTGAVILRLGDQVWSVKVDLSNRAVERVEYVPQARHDKADLFNPV